jgi:hypothetical protein
MNSGSIMIVSRGNNKISDNGGSFKISQIRNNRNSPTKYPIFLMFSQIANYLSEPFWKDFFENASRGSLGKGYKFDERFLIIKNKNEIKKFDTFIENQSEINKLYEECKKFITNTSGISSTCDNNNIYLSEQKKREDEVAWTGNIPAKNQIAMIDIFINRIASHYEFSNEKKYELKTNLIAKIFIDDITSSDIHYENFFIKSIDGLNLVKGNYSFTEKFFKLTQTKSKRKQLSSSIPEKEESFVFPCSKNISHFLKKSY